MADRPPPCDTPSVPHSLTRARLYPCGWRCSRHAPWALAGHTEAPHPAPWSRPRPSAVTEQPPEESS